MAAHDSLMRLPRRGLAAAFLLGAALSGCATPATSARRAAAKMLDPAATPRQELEWRQRLIESGPAAQRWLERAFFPIGLYDVPEEALDEIGAAGFNLVANGDSTPGYLARAQAAGLRVMPYIRLDNMARDAADARGQAGLFAWYLADEPDLNGLVPEKYRDMAERLRLLDPDRPVFLTVFSPRKCAAYAGSADIIAPTPYPVRHADAERNDLRAVARALDAARCAAPGKPLWAVLQAFHAEPDWQRNPTPAELRAMTFLALNHGADGLIYFSYRSGDRPITQRPELYPELRSLNSLVNSLRGSLLSRPILPARVTVLAQESRAQAPFARPANDESLDATVRRFGRDWLLIAVNPDPWAKEVEIALPAAAPAARARELPREDAEEVVFGKGAPIRLVFRAHEARLFRLTR